MVLKIIVGIVLVLFGIYHIKYNKKSSKIRREGNKKVYNTVGLKHVAEFQDKDINKALVGGTTYIGGVFCLIIGTLLIIIGINELIRTFF